MPIFGIITIFTENQNPDLPQKCNFIQKCPTEQKTRKPQDGLFILKIAGDFPFFSTLSFGGDLICVQNWMEMVFFLEFTSIGNFLVVLGQQ